MMRADGHAVSTSTVERALRRRGLLLPRGFRADRKSRAALRRKLFRDPPSERNWVWQTDFSEFETPSGGIWRICAVIDRGTIELVDETTGEIIDVVPAPIALVSDNGPCFRGETYKTAFAGEDPLLRHVRTRVRSPQTNGVIERFFGTLKYEHLYRAPTDDGGALAMETARFRDIYNRIRPHQSLGDRTPRDAYLGITGWGVRSRARLPRHSTGRGLRDRALSGAPQLCWTLGVCR